MKKIHIVWRSGGEYDGYYEDIDSIWTSRIKANDRAQEIKEKQIKQHKSRESIDVDSYFINKLNDSNN